MEKLQKIYPFILFAIFVSIAFWDLPKTFFQQDEWWGFGKYMANESYGGIAEVIKNTIVIDKVHFTPISNVGYYLQYKLFGLNFPFYSFVSIFTHTLNAFLVYIFVSKILRNKYLATLSGLLFAINSVSHQAVSWVAASLNTQGSTFFSLLAYITFFLYLSTTKKNTKILIASFVSIVIALLFKETLAPFFLLPILLILYSRKDIKTAFIKILKPFSLIFFFYILLRVILFIFASPLIVGGVEAEQARIDEYIFRLIILPFRVVAQSLLPANSLLFLSESLMRLAYPQFVYSDNSVDPFIRETTVYDLVCIFVTGIVLFFSYISYIYFKKKNENFSKGIVLFLLIIIFSSILIIFIPGKAGFVFFIEPRHLYSGSFGSSALLVLTFFGLFSFLLEQKAKLLLITIIIPISVAHIILIKNGINQLEFIGITRKNILSTIKQAYPRLPMKVLFYTQSDTAYYGMPDNEKILPVQIGFGKMLMIWYQKDEKLPGCLYKEDFLYDLLEEGYRYCENRGFGYFRDYDKLVEAVKANSIKPDEVISYEWNGNDETFNDISLSVRSKLSEDLGIHNETFRAK